MAGVVVRGGVRAERYGRVAVAFHWTIAALVLANLAIGVLHDSVLRGAMPLHKSIGLTVLALTVARLGWRLAHRPPPLPAAVPGWQRGLSHGVHWLLYALMVLLPVTGWMMVSGGPVRRPLTWFGLFDIAYLPIGEAGADAAHGRHVALGWAMLALVALHVGAALYHHLVRGDPVLARMAPALAKRS